MSEAEKVSAANPTLKGYDFDPDALRNRYREERDKRIRTDGNEQYLEVKGDFSRYIDDLYVKPGFTRAPLRARP
jgi:cyclohexanone monooxygenase